MSHRHFCDSAGHYWDCDGAALRPMTADAEPSACVCFKHQVSMDDGDHSQCPIELLACPEHGDEQLQQMIETKEGDDPPDDGGAESGLFKDEDGNAIVGFCLWCNQNFYSMAEAEEHNAENSKACPVFQELKDEDCGPPVLWQMLNDLKPENPSRPEPTKGDQETTK